MLIHLPDIDEPFCVTEHFCCDHRVNLSQRHYEILKHGHYKSFVLLDREQQIALDKLRGEQLWDLLSYNNQLWQKWVDENFNGVIIRANVTVTTENGSMYNGNYLYGFEDPNDALIFKLKWI